MLKDRDRAILQKIVIYCQQIEQTVARFGADFETYCADPRLSQRLLYVHFADRRAGGEVERRTDRRLPQYPVAQHPATRNLFAHAYGNVSARITWQTIREDIPELRENCRKILASGGNRGRLNGGSRKISPAPLTFPFPSGIISKV